jgi:hypothetical protein
MGVGYRPGRPWAPHKKKRLAKSRGEMARPKSPAGFHTRRRKNVMLLCEKPIGVKLRPPHGR